MQKANGRYKAPPPSERNSHNFYDDIALQRSELRVPTLKVVQHNFAGAAERMQGHETLSSQKPLIDLGTSFGPTCPETTSNC
jgi:hypothetical protein